MQANSPCTVARLLGLTVLATALVGMILHRVAAPAPAQAATGSAATACHIVPNDRNQLVIYDAKTHRLLSYIVLHGTELRLQGWRNQTDDPRIWDSAQLKATAVYAIETKDGASTRYLRKNTNPQIGSMEQDQQAVRDKNDIHLSGLAGE